MEHLQEFREYLNKRVDREIEEILSVQALDKQNKMLDNIYRDVSILSSLKSIEQAEATMDFTKILEEQTKNIDFSKVDFNQLMREMKGNI